MSGGDQVGDRELTRARPRRKEGIVERELDEALLLYDPENDQLVRLNGTSAAIWDLCDGGATVEAIGCELARAFPGHPPSSIHDDVCAAVRHLARNSLLSLTDNP